MTAPGCRTEHDPTGCPACAEFLLRTQINLLREALDSGELPLWVLNRTAAMLAGPLAFVNRIRRHRNGTDGG